MSSDHPIEPPSDDSSKVINIFQRHRRGEHLHFPIEEGGELIVSPDGFNYVTFREEKAPFMIMQNPATHEQTHSNHEEIAHKKHYIFKFMEHHRDHTRIDNYYISGNRLQEFIDSLARRPGQLIEIKQFIPDHIG